MSDISDPRYELFTGNYKPTDRELIDLYYREKGKRKNDPSYKPNEIFCNREDENESKSHTKFQIGCLPVVIAFVVSIFVTIYYIVAAMDILGPGNEIDAFAIALPQIVTAYIMLYSIAFMIMVILGYVRSKNESFSVVDAECMGLAYEVYRKPDEQFRERVRTYLAYKYYYQGKELQTILFTSSINEFDSIPTVGSRAKLEINEENPYEAWLMSDGKTKKKRSLPLTIVLSAFCIIVALVAGVMNMLFTSMIENALVTDDGVHMEFHYDSDD